MKTRWQPRRLVLMLMMSLLMDDCVARALPAIGGGMLRSFYDPEGNMLQIVQR